MRIARPSIYLSIYLFWKGRWNLEFELTFDDSVSTRWSALIGRPWRQEGIDYRDYDDYRGDFFASRSTTGHDFSAKIATSFSSARLGNVAAAVVISLSYARSRFPPLSLPLLL